MKCPDLQTCGLSNLTSLTFPFPIPNTRNSLSVFCEIGRSFKELEDKGLKGLASSWFRSMTNSKHPIHTPEDVKGLKIRTNQNPMYVKAFQLLGANPVPMPLSELYTALETRAVDAQEHPIGIVWSVKLYEVQKYLSLTNHGYTPLLVVMNKAKFDGLSPELQKLLLNQLKKQVNINVNLTRKKKLKS